MVGLEDSAIGHVDLDGGAAVYEVVVGGGEGGGGDCGGGEWRKEEDAEKNREERRHFLSFVTAFLSVPYVLSDSFRSQP